MTDDVTYTSNLLILEDGGQFRLDANYDKSINALYISVTGNKNLMKIGFPPGVHSRSALTSATAL